MNKKTILIIGNSSGSIIGFRMPIIKELLSLNYDVFVAAPTFDELELKRLDDLSIKAYSYHLNSSGVNPIEEIKTIRSICDILRVVRPDCVFSYFTKPVIYSSIASKIVGVKKVIGMIEGLGITYTRPPSGFSLKQKMMMKIQSILYWISSFCLDPLIVLNSDDESFFIDNFSFRRVLNIGGIGVDLDFFSYKELNSEPIKFLFVGRLLKEKGIINFLESAEEVKKLHPECTFTVLGSIDKTNSNSISKSKLDEFIEKGVIDYPGLVNNVEEYIENCTIFVLPSYYREGLPRSTQEALAVGRPIITSNTAGCIETVDENKNGILIDPYSKDELKHAMLKLVCNKENLVSMGIHSRRIAVERFDQKVINKTILDIISID